MTKERYEAFLPYAIALNVEKPWSKYFEKVLPESFLRVHQSHLVNRDQIDAYIKTEGGYLKMKDGADVPVSVRKKAQVVEMLK